MKYRKHKLLTVFTFLFSFIFIAVFSNFKVDASSTYWDFSDIAGHEHCDLLTDNQSNIYVISIINDKVVAKQIKTDNTCFSASFYLNGSCSSYYASNSKLYFASPGGKSDTEITIYDFDSNSLMSCNIKDIAVKEKFHFTVAQNGNMYILDSNNRSTIRCYSESGNPLFSYDCNANLIHLTTDRDGSKIYCFSADKIFTMNLSGKSLSFLTNHSLNFPVWITENNCAVDSNGNITNLNSAQSNYIPTYIQSKDINLAVAGDYICRGYGRQINGYNIYSGRSAILYKTDRNNDFMCSVDGDIITFSRSDGCLTIISSNDFDYPPNEPSDPSQSQVVSSQVQQFPSSEIDGANINISSSKYKIDNSSGIITGIKSGTTVAAFKNNISFGNLSLSITDYKNASKVSGNIGTAATAHFSYKNSSKASYKIIVPGDLTGEGNINSRDTAALTNHLLGKTRLDNYFYLAADCNNDGNVDTLDLLKIAKNNI